MAKQSRKIRVYDQQGNLTHKQCGACKEVKAIDDFYVKGKRSQTNVDGRGHDCIPCHKEKWRKRGEDPMARVRWLLERIRSKCKKEDIPFDLCVEDISVPDRCPVLDRPLRFGVKRHQSYERRGMAPPTDDSPSVDRIDPTKGYVKGNVVVVSWRANRIKWNATPEELIRVAKFYEQYAKGKKAKGA